MMRSMFAAISGLKSHQVMLDVAAADIANVNTLGYKASRMTFRDSLAQQVRGGAGAGHRSGWLERRSDRPRHPGRLDRQPDDGGALQTTGNPSTWRSPARAGSAWARHGGTAAAPTVPTVIATPVPATSPRTTTATSRPQDGNVVVGRTRLRAAAGRRPTRAPDPARPPRTWRSGRTAASSTSRQVAARGSPRATSRWRSSPNQAGSRASRLEQLAAGNNCRCAAGRARPGRARYGLTASVRDRDVERRPRAAVHEHDHRAARLPGELACDLDRRPDAPGPGEPGPLTKDSPGGPGRVG